MKFKIPTISIIIANYNSSKTIIGTLDSLVKQSYTDFEIIFCDDHSTDSSVDLAYNFSKKNKLNFKLFKTRFQSGRASVPKNLGIKNARGSYLAFLDSDDGWYKDKLSLSLNHLRKGADIVYHDLDIVYSEKIKNNKNYAKKTTLKTRDFYSKNRKYFLENGNCITSSSVVLRKEIFDKCGLFDVTGPPEDLDLWIRIEESGFKFERIKGIHGYYTIHSNNVSTSRRGLERYHALIKKYKNFYDEASLPSWICLNISRCYYLGGIYYKSMKYGHLGLKSRKKNVFKTFLLIKYLLQSYMHIKFSYIMKMAIKIKNFF